MKTPEAAVRRAVTSHLPYDHNFRVIGTHRLTHEELVAYHYLGLRRGETQPRPVIGFSAVEHIGELWRYTGGGECGVPEQFNRHVLCLFGRNGNTLSPFTLVVGRVYGTAVAAVEPAVFCATRSP